MDKSPPPQIPANVAAFVLAIILIGQAIAIGAERFSAIAVILIGVSIVLVAAGVWGIPKNLPASVLLVLMVVAVAGGFFRLSLNDVFFRDPRSRPALVPFTVLAVIAAIPAVVIFFARSRSLRTASFWLLIAIHALMGFIAVVARVPGIDVYVIQTLGCESLTRGENPFAITFPNPYGPTAGFYPPGIVVDGQVQCGYFYPPLSLLLDVPGYLLGDVRFSHVAALTLSALMIGYMRAGGGGFAAAVMLMFAPRVFYQLQVAWIEPFVFLMLVATTFFALRQRYTLAAIALGLFLVSKQYAIFALPAAMLLIPRPWNWKHVLRWAVIAALAGGAVTLPFVLWNPKAFFHSLTALYVGMLRQDSISFLPPLANTFGFNPSLAYAALAAVPAIVLSLWRAPRSPDGFAASAALILLCAFAFSTQSFGNYYFLVIGALCTAIAAAPVTPPAAQAATPPR